MTLITSPHWRWSNALTIVAEKKTEFARAGALRREDDYTARAVRFLVSKDQRQYCEDRDVSAAYSLFTDPRLHTYKAVIEAMLLAGMSDEDIAQETTLQELAVDAYDKLFFNVRPYLSKPAMVCIMVFNGMAHSPVNKLSKSEIMLRIAYLGRKDMLMEFIRSEGNPVMEAKLIAYIKSAMKKRAFEYVLQGGGEEAATEQLKLVLDKREEDGVKGSDQVAKATAEFLAGVSLTVADPTDKRNLALPAREPRLADYSGTPQ
jgi:hypothetical protein